MSNAERRCGIHGDADLATGIAIVAAVVAAVVVASKFRDDLGKLVNKSGAQAKRAPGEIPADLPPALSIIERERDRLAQELGFPEGMVRIISDTEVELIGCAVGSKESSAAHFAEVSAREELLDWLRVSGKTGTIEDDFAAQGLVTKGGTITCAKARAFQIRPIESNKKF